MRLESVGEGGEAVTEENGSVSRRDAARRDPVAVGVDRRFDDKLRLGRPPRTTSASTQTSACRRRQARRRGRHHDRGSTSGWKAAREKRRARRGTHINDVQAVIDILAGGRHRDRGAVLHRQLADRQYAEDWTLSRMMKRRPTRSSGRVQPARRVRHRGHHALAPRVLTKLFHERGRARRCRG